MVKHITPYQKDQNKKYYNANSLDIKIRRAFKAYDTREEMYTIIKGVISKEDAAKCIGKAPQTLANLQGPNRLKTTYCLYILAWCIRRFLEKSVKSGLFGVYAAE
jgi:hypothetical protein